MILLEDQAQTPDSRPMGSQKTNLREEMSGMGMFDREKVVVVSQEERNFQQQGRLILDAFGFNINGSSTRDRTK